MANDLIQEADLIEWTVKTPNVGNRGTRRIVVDTKTGDAFYSHDHYDSFIKIDMSGWK